MNLDPAFPIVARRGQWRYGAMCALLISAGFGVSAHGGSKRAESSPVAEAALLRAAGEGFELKTTAHFLIAHEGDPDPLRDFVARIEATYRGAYRFLNSYDFDSTIPQQKLEIFFFTHPDGFFDYAKRTGSDVRGAAGFYSPRTNRAAFYHALNMPRLEDVNEQIASIEVRLKDPRKSKNIRNRKQVLKRLRRLRIERDRTIESVNQLVVQHEVAHQVLYNAGLHRRGADQPTWLVEGLACLFETPPNRDGAGFATINQYRLLNLREALSGKVTPKKLNPDSYGDALRQGRLVSLRRLIGDKSLFNTTRTAVENAYAQAWSLTYYLHRRKREAFGEYLTVLAERPVNQAYSPATEVQIFEEIFGPIDEAFVQDWLDFCLGLRPRKIR